MPLTDADRWTIGRTELKNGPQRLPGPQSMTQQGDTVRISGRFYSGDTVTQQTDMRIFRQQWLGMNELDVVPFVCPDDYDLTGFYRPVSAQFTAEKGGRDAGFGAYSVNLERMGGGYASLMVEQVYVAAGELRPNNQAGFDPGLNGAYARMIPADASIWEFGGSTIPSETGDVRYLLAAVGPSGTAYGNRYQIDPSNYFDTSCRVEVRIAGAWFVAVGKQIPATTVDNIRITNGILRVQFNSATNRVVLQKWNGTAWGVTHAFYAQSVQTPFPAWELSSTTPVVVTRNDNATVTIQVATIDPEVTNVGPNVITLSLSRGVAAVSCVLESLNASNLVGSFIRYDTYDGTTDLSEQLENFGATVDYGTCIRSDTLDSDGNEWFILASETTGTASTKGTVRSDANGVGGVGAGQSIFAVGVGAPDSAGVETAGDPFFSTTEARMWFGPAGITERVVAR